MTSFLGVPIQSRNEVYGNLYLTERRGGGSFTTEDADLLLALAATAGIAIENASLYAESRRRQEWAQTAAEITTKLLSPDDGRRTVAADRGQRATPRRRRRGHPGRSVSRERDAGGHGGERPGSRPARESSLPGAEQLGGSGHGDGSRGQDRLGEP